MNNPLRGFTNIFKPETAMEDGWNYQHKPPVLSPEKRKALMEASSLETPRSSLHAAFHIMKPYWTKASVGERTTAAALLATSLFMTWYAVQVTVEFGQWQSGLTNTVQQLFTAMMGARTGASAELLPQFPLFQQALTADPQLTDLITKFPDMSTVMYDPAYSELLKSTPELADLLSKNPTMEQIFTAYPGMQDKIAQSPEILEQLRGYNTAMGEKLSDLPVVKGHLSNLMSLCGGDFLKTWGNAVSASFNSASGALMDPESNQAAKNALKEAWYSKDLATIALKFTAMSIISYKSAQYLALRWRAWTTAYFTNKFTSFKAFDTMKRHFNNIDNPGQRIQEDPASFTAGMVSLTTGVMGAAMTMASFSGMLWGMGTLYGVPGGFFWLGAAYASALTAMTVGAGWKLPWIQRNAQRREADLRRSVEAVNLNADSIAINGTEDVEKELVKKRLKPVLTNSVRDIGTQVKLIVVDATAGNLSIPIPWVVGAFAVAAGTASMGTIQTINYAFNRVTGSMSFIVNRFGQLSAMKATADRMYMMDVAMDAAHYIEEEKRQAALKALPPPPAAPGVK